MKKFWNGPRIWYQTSRWLGLGNPRTILFGCNSVLYNNTKVEPLKLLRFITDWKCAKKPIALDISYIQYRSQESQVTYQKHILDSMH